MQEPDKPSLSLNLSGVDLSLVGTDDLIHELLKREIAMVIGMVRKDGTTGPDGCLVGRFYNGTLPTCSFVTVEVLNMLIKDTGTEPAHRAIMRNMLARLQAESLLEDSDEDFEPDDLGPFPDAPQG